MNGRILATVTVAALLFLSGCSGMPGAATPTGDLTSTPNATYTETTTPTEIASPTAANALVESGPGEYPHDVRIANWRDEDVTLTVTVERNGSEIFRTNATMPAESAATVAGFTAMVLPEDDRDVTVAASDDRGGFASVQVSIYDCLGDVEFYYTEGELQGTYSIC